MQRIDCNVNESGAILNAYGRASAVLPVLTMGAAQTLLLCVRNRDGLAVDPPGAERCDAFRLSLAGDFDRATDPEFRTVNGVKRTGPGTFEIDLSLTATHGMKDYLGKRPGREIGAELVGIAPGQTWAEPAFVLQFALWIKNRRDVSESQGLPQLDGWTPAYPDTARQTATLLWELIQKLKG